MIRKMWIIFLIIAIFIFSLIAIYSYFSNPIPEIEKECELDSDCVKIRTTCCPCNMGGIEKCVPKSKLTEYQEKLNNCDVNGLFCTAMYNCYIESCECLNGNCTTVKIEE